MTNDPTNDSALLLLPQYAREVVISLLFRAPTKRPISAAYFRSAEQEIRLFVNGKEDREIAVAVLLCALDHSDDSGTPPPQPWMAYQLDDLPGPRLTEAIKLLTVLRARSHMPTGGAWWLTPDELRAAADLSLCGLARTWIDADGSTWAEATKGARA